MKRYDGYKTAYVQIGNHIQPFSIASVKQYIEKDIIDELEEHLSGVHFITEPSEGESSQEYNLEVNDESCDEAKATEIRNLLQRKTYEIVEKDDVPANAQTLRSRFVLTDKISPNGQKFKKARLVILGHTDPDKSLIFTEAPTVKRYSVRLLLVLALMKDMYLWTRYVSKLLSNLKIISIVGSSLFRLRTATFMRL